MDSPSVSGFSQIQGSDVEVGSLVGRTPSSRRQNFLHTPNVRIQGRSYQSYHMKRERKGSESSIEVGSWTRDAENIRDGELF
jgi:hypothetical protein